MIYKKLIDLAGCPLTIEMFEEAYPREIEWSKKSNSAEYIKEQARAWGTLLQNTICQMEERHDHEENDAID